MDPARLGRAGAVAAARRFGHPLQPVLTGPTLHTGGMRLSTAVVWMRPHDCGRAVLHHHTAAVLVVQHGTALVAWWDEHDTCHELHHPAGHHLYLPPRTRYQLSNPHDVPLIAILIRDHPTLHADTDTDPLMPD